ncbi:hypothetical protein QUF49_14180 [Fictibacillus sp. b24]|uniref:hypothetical protein n=1 Tax=Fictibacillus sp. b24 TaxID=3055863 RepID=UPI0025A0D6A3|nr:hypothetical protein [Fictibacillus sp. b24]MDM5317152.1 hypothetical protein [Fictibacillus sp. b24]
MENLRKLELAYFLGFTTGAVIGFILAKVYQTWALLYEMRGRELDSLTNWQHTPLWQTVNENPGITTLIVTLLFSAIGLCFAHLFTKINEPYYSENNAEMMHVSE